MIKHNFKIVFRSLFRNKLHSFINISTLAVGIAVFILISIYVKHELSYDKFHENYDRIYQVSIDNEFSTAAPIGTMLKNKLPQIEHVVRIDFFRGGGKSARMKDVENTDNEYISISDVIFADSTFFDVFRFKILYGDKLDALNTPKSLVLNKSTSLKIFGAENSVGKTVTFIGEGGGTKCTLRITAIVEDIPENSSLNFNGVISLESFKALKITRKDMDVDWGNWGYHTFVLRKNIASGSSMEESAGEIWTNHEKAYYKDRKHKELNLIALKDVPFYGNNKLQMIQLMMVVGLLVLIIAIVNFVNLSMAKSSTRVKEIGIKKISGSKKFALIKQIIFESIIFSVLATLIALLMAELLKPFLNSILGKNLSIGYIEEPFILLLVFLGVIIIGIVSGIFPAIFLTSHSPVKYLKNEISKGKKGKFITQSLIVFQFAVSISLIIAMSLIYKQIKYLKTKDLGINPNQVIYVKPSTSILKKYDLFKQKSLEIPHVSSLALSGGKPGGKLGQSLVMSCTRTINNIQSIIWVLPVDLDFIKTMGVEIIDGRIFSPDLETDRYGAIIINESALKKFELEDPIEMEVVMFDSHNSKIVGVMKDFHPGSFHDQVEPIALWYAPGWYWDMHIRLNSTDINETLSLLKDNWDEFSPEIPFAYHFLSNKYDLMYKDEVKFGNIILGFSILAVFIACMGLFGLTILTNAQRTKEIGIRKVNGAKTFEILRMLNKNFIKWVAIAFIIACPIAWYAMNSWLENFAYKTELSWWIFALAGGIALSIALATVSWQSWRAASRNPVEALRYE